ncbi:MAG: hypothetical protein IJ731_06165 [Eubacterium sp.]|nr:hypothetical protein [Eubacterium sp.]
MSKRKNHNEWVERKCPFFHSDSVVPNASIYCEGPQEKTSLQIFFCSKNQFLEWQAKYCNNLNDYQQCPIFKISNKKYEE